MSQVAAMLQELDQEAHTTRRLLERVPDERLEWKPHPKARTLGQLALHVAAVPGLVAGFACRPSPVQMPTFDGDPSPASAAELLTALSESISTAKAKVGALDDAALTAPWRLMAGDRELIAAPLGGFLRSVMLNHWYHHRGQLSVYLRELDVPIPSIYGPSADENPFG
jgi:uncharacterized damage-inducible protein DinB